MKESFEGFIKFIEDISVRLPSEPNRPRRNFFDILGIKNKEIQNSKVLAYFFNPNEEHGFGYLFKDSLLEIVQRELTEQEELDEIFFSEILNVETEVITSHATKKEDRNKFIDIVIKGLGWQIIIENKIHHHLNNNLNAYYQHSVSGGDKVLPIVLSLRKVKNKGKLKLKKTSFYSITHIDLIDEINKKFSFTENVNEIDLFYLREYFKTITSHYQFYMNKPKHIELVQAIAHKSDEIKTIISKKNTAEQIVYDVIDEKFNSFEYEKASKWYRRKDKLYDLYFYIPPAETLLLNDEILLYFEFRNHTNSFIRNEKPKLIDTLSEQLAPFTKLFKKETIINLAPLQSTKDHTHIFVYQEIDFFTKGDSFDIKFESILKKMISKENSLVATTEKFVDKHNLNKRIHYK